MLEGVRSNNIDPASIVDEVLGNVTKDGIVKTGRIATAALGAQIAQGAGAIVAKQIKSTFEQLDAIKGTMAEGDVGLVMFDDDEALRGRYAKEGGVLVWKEALTETQSEYWAGQAKLNADRVDLGALDQAVIDAGAAGAAQVVLAEEQVTLAGEQVTLAGEQRVGAEQARTDTAALLNQAQNAVTAPFKGVPTETALLANLAPADGIMAYAMDTGRLYTKNGATGVGGWTAGPVISRDGPNLLFDPFNEVVTEDSNAGGYNWFSGPGGSIAATYPSTRASANIPLKTPVLVNTGSSGSTTTMDRYWPLATTGLRPGDQVTIGVICFFSNAGGGVQLYARDAANTVLASSLANGQIAGLKVVYLTLTVPANTESLMIRVLNTVNPGGIIEVGAYAAARGAQRPSFSVGATPFDVRPNAQPDASDNIVMDPFGELFVGMANYRRDEYYLFGNAQSGPAGTNFNSIRSPSPNSPWGKPGLYYPGGLGTQSVRRLIKLKGVGNDNIQTGDKLRLRVCAYLAGAGVINVFYRRADNGTLSGGNPSYTVAGAGVVDNTFRTFTVPSDIDHVLIEVLTTGDGAAELLGVAIGKNRKPAWSMGPTPMRHAGRVRRQRNLAPDPFWRQASAGINVDGYSPIQEGASHSLVTVAASPYKGKVGLQFTNPSATRNRRIDGRRLGLQVGEKLTIRTCVLFENDNPLYGLGFNFRKSDSSVVLSTSFSISPGDAKAGVPFIFTYSTTVTQAMVDDVGYLELRYNVAGVAVTGNVWLLGLGIYVGEEYPNLDDTNGPDDIAAIALKASLDNLQAQITANAGLLASTPNNWGGKMLRQARFAMTRRKLGYAARIVHLALGDSLTHNRERYAHPLLVLMQQLFGDGGGGYTGFPDLSANAGTFNNGNVRQTTLGNGGATTPLYTYSRTGTWTTDSLYYSGGGPDLGAISTTTAGARAIVAKPAGSPVHTDCVLFYKKTADGLARFSWDGGTTWAALDLTGSVGDFGTISLAAGMPAGASTCIVEVVSGTNTWHGVNWVSAASGYVLHKCGATGSSTASWLAINSAYQQATWAALGANLVSIMLATNDNNGPMTKATYKANVEAMILRVRAALPAADIWLVSVAQTPRVMSVAMDQYAAACFELAIQYGCCFEWQQDVMGDKAHPEQYAFNGIRKWYADDNNDGLTTNDVHPKTAPQEEAGGIAMAGDMFNALCYYP